jgi:tetratricopeptide (TPR) repeat protein
MSVSPLNKVQKVTAVAAENKFLVAGTISVGQKTPKGVIPGINPPISPLQIVQKNTQFLNLEKNLLKLQSIEQPNLTEQEAKEGFNKAIALAKAIIKGIEERFPDSYKKKNIAEKLAYGYEIMKREGYQIAPQYDEALVFRNILAGFLDCDSSSFILYSVSEHLGWEVGMVNVPEHSFLYVKDEGKSVDYDDKLQKPVIEDNFDFFIKKHDIPEENRSKVLKVHYGEDIWGQAYFNVGLAMEDKGLIREALQFYDLALESNPDNPEYLSARATIYSKYFRRDSEAIRDSELAHEMLPKNTKYIFYLGINYMKDKQYKKAEVSFKKAIEYSPKNSEYRGLLGKNYLLQKKYQEAFKMLKRSLILNNQDGRVWFFLAELYYENKMYPAALRSLDNALEWGASKQKISKLRKKIGLEFL